MWREQWDAKTAYLLIWWLVNTVVEVSLCSVLIRIAVCAFCIYRCQYELMKFIKFCVHKDFFLQQHLRDPAWRRRGNAEEGHLSRLNVALSRIRMHYKSDTNRHFACEARESVRRPVWLYHIHLFRPRRPHHPNPLPPTMLLEPSLWLPSSHSPTPLPTDPLPPQPSPSNPPSTSSPPSSVPLLQPS